MVSRRRRASGAIVHVPENCTPLSMKISGECRVPETRAGTYSSMARAARTLPGHGAALDDHRGDVDFGLDLGSVADHQGVRAADLAAEAAVDADPALELQFALEMGAPAEQSGDFSRGEWAPAWGHPSEKKGTRVRSSQFAWRPGRISGTCERRCSAPLSWRPAQRAPRLTPGSAADRQTHRAPWSPNRSRPAFSQPPRLAQHLLLLGQRGHHARRSAWGRRIRVAIRFTS